MSFRPTSTRAGAPSTSYALTLVYSIPTPWAPMPLADLRRAKPPPPLLSFELVDAQSSLVWAYRTACNLAPRLPAPSKLDGHRRTLADAS
ncbi:hypothetical protein AURDEDRAFT_171493 [Auricularia subglabra TFB-10046 SS5]|nr:hypothetical protein AURDEDRAFT_171493 [Auricularia subglabra TFB-10046 SS5]